MNKTILVQISIVFFIEACTPAPQTEKRFNEERSKTVDVSGAITDIAYGQNMSFIALKMLDSLLVVEDVMGSTGRPVHLLSAKTFKPVAAAGTLGKGPGEIIRSGDPAYDSTSRTLWLNDHGRECVWAFPIDSVLRNPGYKPSLSLKLNNELFFDDFTFLNDSMAIGVAVHYLPGNAFEKKMALQNFRTNQIREFGYEHPDARGRFLSYFRFAANPKKGVYVKAHSYLDLLTICNLSDGSLRVNIYGRNWKHKSKRILLFYTGVDFYRDYILAAYVEDDHEIVDRFGRERGNSASRLLVFDINGNYLKTIETGNRFSGFCVDEPNERIIAYFWERENPIGYFSLKGIL